MKDINMVEIAFFMFLGFYVTIWGNPIDHVIELLKKKKNSTKTIYVKNDKELQKVVQDWQDDKIEILSFSHNLVNGGYEVIVKPISKN